MKNKNSTLDNAFAARVMEFLIKNNMSKYRLEKDSGLTHSAMMHIFNGDNKDVKLSTVAKVCRVFNITLEQFFASGFDLTKIDIE